VRGGRYAAWAGFLGLVALAAGSLPHTRTPAFDQAPCEHAIVVDGRLACDGELDPITAGGCPDLGEIPAGSRVDGRCSVRADPRLMRALRLPVDVNSAGPDALQTLPGIGPVLADRIVAGRPFPSLDALQSVSGIGPATVRRIASRARVDPREPARDRTRESSHPDAVRPNSGPHED